MTKSQDSFFAIFSDIHGNIDALEAVLVDIGVPMGPVIASIHERRDEFRRVLQAAASGSGPGEAAGEPRRTGGFRARRSVGQRAV